MTDSIWTSPHYKIRKKILAIANQYWIEDGQGRTLGFTKQKLLRLREDIRIYADEGMTRELFWVHQEQVLDAWGTFAVVDTAANVCVGKIRRNVMSGCWRRILPKTPMVSRSVGCTRRRDGGWYASPPFGGWSQRGLW